MKTIKTIILEYDETKISDEEICKNLIQFIIDKNKELNTNIIIEIGPWKVENGS